MSAQPDARTIFLESSALALGFRPDRGALSESGDIIWFSRDSGNPGTPYGFREMEGP